MTETTKAKKEKRSSEAEEDEMKLKLNVGAFIRKATRNGRDKTMSTYWSYKGSLTTPGEYTEGQLIYIFQNDFT